VVQPDFQSLKGIGPSLAQDLIDLGYGGVSDQVGEDPQNMYDTLMDLRAEHIDRCVLYVFRCAVYQAEAARPDPDLSLWWNWKDRS